MAWYDLVFHLKENSLLGLVSCSADLSVRLWDFQNYQCVKTMHGNSEENRVLHGKNRF